MFTRKQKRTLRGRNTKQTRKHIERKGYSELIEELVKSTNGISEEDAMELINSIAYPKKKYYGKAENGVQAKTKSSSKEEESGEG